MTTSDANPEDLHGLFGMLRDGNASQHHVSKLESLISGDSTARQEFLLCSAMHAFFEKPSVDLEGILDTSEAATLGKTANADAFRRRGAPRRFAAVATVICLLILACYVPFSMIHDRESTGPRPSSRENLLIIETHSENAPPPPNGNYEPSDLMYLIPDASIVVTGTVANVTASTVEFEIDEVLKGTRQRLKLNSDLAPGVGCAAGTRVWPRGQKCCLFLEYNQQTGLYEVMEYGAGIQPLPYRGVIESRLLKTLIAEWDGEYGHLTWPERQMQYEEADRMGKVVYDLVTRPGDNQESAELVEEFRLLTELPE